MPRFAANLTTLWTDRSLVERVSAARAAGFEAVEILFPYDDPVPELRDRLAAEDMRLVLINGPPPNYTGGERGFAAVPGADGRFRSDLRRVLRYARALGVSHIHLMAGAAAGREARETYVRNLAHAAAEAPDRIFTIEPINRIDMPGYFLADYDLARDIVAEVGAPNLRLQFDAYHAHRITGDVAAAWAAVAPLVSHVQIAGYPGRHEPVGGEIDYCAFFRILDRSGYGGWVSAEYDPEGDTDGGLGWLGLDCATEDGPPGLRRRVT